MHDFFTSPHFLGSVNKPPADKVLPRKRRFEPNLSESEYSSDDASRNKRKYSGNPFIFIFGRGYSQRQSLQIKSYSQRLSLQIKSYSQRQSHIIMFSFFFSRNKESKGI